jgi:hypothetical protein
MSDKNDSQEGSFDDTQSFSDDNSNDGPKSNSQDSYEDS